MRSKHKGAHSELIACAWLLQQGYEVFRNISQHGIVDIIAIKDGEQRKFDVKTCDGEFYRLLAEQVAAGVEVLAVRRSGGCEIIGHALRAITLSCDECRATFAALTRKNQQRRFCSAKCREIFHGRKLREAYRNRVAEVNRWPPYAQDEPQEK